MTQEEIESRLAAIETRNVRVADDKAWEVSTARRMTIAVMTYAVAVMWLLIINVANPFLSAFVPVLGYLLSTLSLPLVRRVWRTYQ